MSSRPQRNISGSTEPLPTTLTWSETLRKRVAATPFMLDEEVGGASARERKLTFSAGLASCPVDAVDMPSLMRRADQRLIKAKHGGRNRVVARE